MNDKFTCALCSSVFDTNVEQRTHMQSPWHIWNLKRQIASLPALSSKIFEEQVVSTKLAGSSATNDRRKSSDPPVEEGNDSNSEHLTSRPFLDLVSSEEDDDYDNEDEDDSTETDFDPSTCLFCTIVSSAVSSNLSHMQKTHGLFIPNSDSLDIIAFLSYLSLLVNSFHECLYCGAAKSSAEGAKAHMRGKGHCKLSDEEILHLYEFHEGNDGDRDRDEDGEKGKGIDLATADADDGLTLPSGKTIGHRSKLRYYHQHHRTSNAETSSLVPVEGVPVNESGGSLIKTEKRKYNSHQLAVLANTERGLVGISEVQKRALRAVEKKALKLEGRKKNEYRLAVDRKGNKQKHFRPDVPGPSNG